MGLSEEERTSKLFHSISRAVGYADEARERFPEEIAINHLLEKLFTFVDRLWPAFLGSKKHTDYWLVGSETHVVTEPTAPWSAALISRYDLAVAERTRKRLDRHLKSVDQDDEKYIIPEWLNVLTILGYSSHPIHAHVLNIYVAVEEVSYALRRYNDDYRRRFAELDTLVSNIYGTAYSIFSEGDNFAKAHLLNRIAVWLYGDEWDCSQDPFGRWLVDSYQTGSIAAATRRHSLEELIDIDLAILRGKTTVNARVQLFLKISGERYLHTLESLKEVLKEDSVNWDTAEKTIKRNAKKAFKEDEARKRLHAGHDEENTCIHGYDYKRRRL